MAFATQWVERSELKGLISWEQYNDRIDHMNYSIPKEAVVKEVFMGTTKQGIWML